MRRRGPAARAGGACSRGGSTPLVRLASRDERALHGREGGARARRRRRGGRGAGRARPGRCGCAPCGGVPRRGRRARQPALDGHVDVLEGGLEADLPGVELAPHAVEAGDHLRATAFVTMPPTPSIGTCAWLPRMSSGRARRRPGWRRTAPRGGGRPRRRAPRVRRVSPSLSLTCGTADVSMRPGGPESLARPPALIPEEGFHVERARGGHPAGRQEGGRPDWIARRPHRPAGLERRRGTRRPPPSTSSSPPSAPAPASTWPGSARSARSPPRASASCSAATSIRPRARSPASRSTSRRRPASRRSTPRC